MIMVNKLDENISKLSLLDLNTTNFLLDKDVSHFLDENVSYFYFEPKCQYVFIGQKYQ